MQSKEYDAVIVGSGAAGSLIAAKLAAAGKHVLILEAGAQRNQSEMVSSQIWSRRLKGATSTVATGGKDPLSVGFACGTGTGGSAMHHYACWFRLHPEDFSLQSDFGIGRDWPIVYDDLKPAYDQVQGEVGISGDNKAEVWRPEGDPYPMPPLPVLDQGKLIQRGFDKLGMTTAPMPMAINSEPYQGRPACLSDGWCDAGCPVLALANPVAVYLSQALHSGAKIEHELAVTRVLTNASGNYATGVECFDTEGTRHVINSDLVVLAAYVFETPRILLNSRPEGLANSSGKVGQYMMAHSAASVYGLFNEETQPHAGVTGGQLVCQDDYVKDATKGYIGSSQWLIANAMKPNDLLGIANSRADLFGPALHKYLETATRHLATMTFCGESIAQADNRLTLGDHRDQFGFPLARVSHTFSDDSVRCWQAGMVKGKAIMNAAGAKTVWTGPRAQMHTMGGTVMGVSDKDSVTNGYGQTHDVPNLFIAGSSLFPSTGGVNPTFTINALALRTSQYVLKNWGAFES